jgi:cellulose synthase/poly-beta-1,6-N-acetylglucosamine synthase-like glycosyltransferase
MAMMGSRKNTTLVVSVYNAVRYLEFVLTALCRQSTNDFEVVIADDGSGAEVRHLVERMQRDVPFPLSHLWQPDEGFRKTRILNQAINAAKTDYLIFVDGDCVPHREFIHDHSAARQNNAVLCGRRVNFSKQVTDRLSADSIRTGAYERLSLNVWFDGLLARSSNLEDGIRIGSGFLRRALHWNRARILGCNFSVEKSLLERVNGFNEDYKGPGLGEDTDIAYRLQLAGARLLSLRYQALLYHLYHPATIAGDENRNIFARVVTMREMVCRNGLRKVA